MRNKIEATIQLDDFGRPLNFIGEVDSVCYDDNGSMSLEIKNAKIIEHKPTKKDYIETDGRTFWKMDIGSYIDDLIQEKLKEIKLDDRILNK